MNSFKRALNIAGWATFAIAFFVFIFSVERTGSLWDCGEFILGADKLQVVHPPGAALFLIIGRMFAILGSIFSSDPSGVAFAIKELNPNVKVYGVQASGAPSMLKSIDDGKIEKLDSVSTIADGIAVKEPGDITFAMCQKYVDGIVTVSDDEIAAAILALIEQQKLITEGAGAVSVAAAMFNKVDVKGKKVCCLLSGGNIDVTILSRVIKRGLLKSGRTYSLTIELLDKPGQLKGVADIIAKEGGNVISIHHERASEGSDINGCYLRIVLETKNFDHIAQIKKALTDAGFIIKSY